MARSLALSTTLAALALAGCGGAASTEDSAGRFKGEDRAVAQTVEDLQDAAQRGDEQRLCSTILSKALVDRFEAAGGAGCAAAIEEAVQDADTFDLTVTKVEVTGATAKATVRSEVGERDKTDALELVKEGGRWKISALQAQA